MSTFHGTSSRTPILQGDHLQSNCLARRRGHEERGATILPGDRRSLRLVGCRAALVLGTGRVAAESFGEGFL